MYIKIIEAKSGCENMTLRPALLPVVIVLDIFVYIFFLKKNIPRIAEYYTKLPILWRYNDM